MTELERFAAAALAQWRSAGHLDSEPMTVGALLDQVLPYRVARRLLGIDVSEDYEARVLELISEEEHLVTTEPLDAAEMAKATVASKLPDLDVLQLLRAATITFARQAIGRLEAATPETPPRHEPSWAPAREASTPTHPAETAVTTAPTSSPTDLRCWSCSEELPAGREFKFCPFCGADQRQPVCAACAAPLERGWKHCAECGSRVSTT